MSSTRNKRTSVDKRNAMIECPKANNTPARHSADSSAYPQAFMGFTANTDEKQNIARVILDIAQSQGANSLLDLGAGDGELTGILASSFHRVVAVEKQKELARALGDLKGVTAVHQTMQAFEPAEKFDTILMSYSFTGVPPEQVESFLTQALSWRSENGQLLTVTFEDNCNWDRYSTAVYERLNLERTGGANLHRERIVEAGFTATPVGRAISHMWSTSLTDLAKMMSFFFVLEEKQYLQRIKEFEALLEPLAETWSDGHVAISASHEICQISSAHFLLHRTK